MAVIAPLREAPPAADEAGAEAPDEHGTIAWFRVGADGGLRLIRTAPLPAGARAATVGIASPAVPS